MVSVTAKGYRRARAEPACATTPPTARLGDLTERERSILALMAEGLSNAAIGKRLFLSESAISKYTTSTFGKLGITDDTDNNRRVLAVLAYLNAPASSSPPPDTRL